MILQDISYYIEKYHVETMMSEVLLKQLKICSFHRGDVILRSNQELDQLYFLVEGKAKSMYVTRSGNETIHCFLTPFNIMGDLEFRSSDRIINDVIALSDVICLCLDVKENHMAMNQDLLFLRYLCDALADKLKYSNQNSSISLVYTVEERLASYLLASCKDDMFDENQSDVANMIGCSYRQLQRTLQKFCQENYLQKLKKGTYRILDKKQLQLLGEDTYHLPK